MKQLLFFFVVGIACSCNNAGMKDAVKDTAASSTTTTTYPYTIEHPDNWVEGSTANTMTALKALKAWEIGKVDESVKYFADSVHVQFDAFDKKLSNDSLKAMFTASRGEYKSMDIKMFDWESVVSKDKKEEWVTLWYTEHWETNKGVKDSAALINDLQLKDGKIVRLDEYTRKLH
jgi:hypothetical protein